MFVQADAYKNKEPSAPPIGRDTRVGLPSPIVKRFRLRLPNRMDRFNEKKNYAVEIPSLSKRPLFYVLMKKIYAVEISPLLKKTPIL